MDIRVIFAGCLVASVLFWSCASDTQQAGDHSLEGFWGLSKASINGKASDRLSSLYFEFSKDSLLHTNILGEDATYPYQRTESEIRQRSVPEIVYFIDQLTDTLLTLTTQIQHADFVLYLGRRSPTEQSTQVTEN